MRPTTIAVAAAIALCAATYGCGSTPVAEASGSRYETEALSMGRHGYAEVVTDTETGQAWLVAWTDVGGVAIERMSPYVSVGMSDDRGE